MVVQRRFGGVDPIQRLAQKELHGGVWRRRIDAKGNDWHVALHRAFDVEAGLLRIIAALAADKHERAAFTDSGAQGGGPGFSRKNLASPQPAAQAPAVTLALRPR